MHSCYVFVQIREHWSERLSRMQLLRGLGDQDNPQGPGFYLITLKGSKQAGLTGLKGGIVRKVAVDRTRSSLEQALETIKQRLESRTN